MSGLMQPFTEQLSKLWARVATIPTLRWATVTNVNPLQVRLDGDLDPLLIPPQTVVSGLPVGQRVICVEQNRRVIVIAAGRFGADIPWTEIALNTGWVNYTGDPALACKINGVIYLRGRVTRESGSSNLIATLPPQFRPFDSALTWATWASIGTERLALNPDGTLVIHGSDTTGVSVLTAFPAQSPTA